ncbi:hypothetical protein J1605_014035 [Eschrichtius robustus]|uniref:Uncharacterized protein n=1 Tax=Eschrichtius robustus TaxID=9764 RepID=A0AB34GHD2_ESCRO|nr:hypothetical protein J1605_014035 [Eschrichtius robustus]
MRQLRHKEYQRFGQNHTPLAVVRPRNSPFAPSDCEWAVHAETADSSSPAIEIPPSPRLCHTLRPRTPLLLQTVLLPPLPQAAAGEVSSGPVRAAAGRPPRRAEPMLDLEVVPERSLGNEQWEFALAPATGCPLRPPRPGSVPLCQALTPLHQASAGPLLGQCFSNNNNNNG